jgi:hypothetical protein
MGIESASDSPSPFFLISIVNSPFLNDALIDDESA